VSFLVICGTTHGSSWLEIYEVMKLEATKMGYESPSWLQEN